MNNSEFILEHKDADVRKLVLQHAQNPHIDIHFVATQISGYQRLKGKVPTYATCEGVLYPVSLSIEQCSSEQTARYKANLLGKGNTLVDLTGGLGIDTFFLSEQYEAVHYVERNKELCEIAIHNFKALGRAHIATHNCDSVGYLETMDAVDCIYIDPARRDTKGAKIAQLHDCEPNVVALQDMLMTKAQVVMVKLSPMIDISHTVQVLNNVHEVHVVSVDNECKEVLLVLKQGHCPSVTIHTANLTKQGIQTLSFNKQEEENSQVYYAQSLGKYLYEPNASVLKAGGFKVVSNRLGLEKLHQHTHLYTSDTLHNDFPGRVFEVQEVFSMQKQAIKQLMAHMTHANIATRNFPKTPEQLRKQLKLKDGGQEYLFAAMYSKQQHAIIWTRKVNSASHTSNSEG